MTVCILLNSDIAIEVQQFIVS